MTVALHRERVDRRPAVGTEPRLVAGAGDPPAGDRAPDGSPELPIWRRALSGLFTMAIIALSIYLWPAPLGGSSRFVVVSGDSMEPTYMYGDIVLTRDRPVTDVGDAVVFQVPDGGAQGMLVIHRVLLVDEEGYFITQGDNRATPDEWQLTEDDIVGQPVLHLPYGGYVVWFLQRRAVIGMLVGLLIAIMLWPKQDPGRGDDRDEDDGGSTLGDEVILSPDAVWLLGGWSRGEIDEATMQDAIAWLDQQVDDALTVPERAIAADPPTECVDARRATAAEQSEFAALAARLRANR